jgi:hypothetical protein
LIDWTRIPLPGTKNVIAGQDIFIIATF